jgi:predicted MFS family arabinose efflux permease
MLEVERGQCDVKRPARILPVIIISQFAGTSLWFVGNAVLPDLQQRWGLPSDALGYMTSAVQLGFIVGTLTFAFFSVSDRFSPRRVFFLCTVLGALLNLGIAVVAHGYTPLLASRFLVGFFIAGVYPVGMKIAASWYQRDLGNAIGFLVGALVLGTAFPHLLKSFGHTLPWETVTFAASGIAVFGGLLMLLLVPDGPYLPNRTKFDPKALALIFSSRAFRASACGYFGHMWELYAFWTFVPVILAAHLSQNSSYALDVSLWAFCIIAAGSIGCAVGGLISLRAGSARVAYAQLFASGVCCLVSPLLFHLPTPAFLALMVFWGIVVVGDSPQFSTLNAHNAPKQLVGSALTIANCIGFSITIFSIQLLNYLSFFVSPAYLYVGLTIGPVLGVLAMRPLLQAEPADASQVKAREAR